MDPREGRTSWYCGFALFADTYGEQEGKAGALGLNALIADSSSLPEQVPRRCKSLLPKAR